MQDQKLQELMKTANEGYRGVFDALSRSIECAVECGDALIEA